MCLQKAHIQRYRALADVTLELRPVNVFFGQNAAGKSSFLDAIWFVRDCAIRGVEEATGDRDHGIGLLWDEEEPANSFSIELETADALYETRFGLTAGRIDPHAGELLVSKQSKRTLIQRSPGQIEATFYHQKLKTSMTVELREPTKLALTRYLDLEEKTAPEALESDRLLRYLHFHDSRSLDFYGLRRRGSESSYPARRRRTIYPSCSRGLNQRASAVSWWRAASANSLPDPRGDSSGWWAVEATGLPAALKMRSRSLLGNSSAETPTDFSCCRRPRALSTQSGQIHLRALSRGPG